MRHRSNEAPNRAIDRLVFHVARAHMHAAMRGRENDGSVDSGALACRDGSVDHLFSVAPVTCHQCHASCANVVLFSSNTLFAYARAAGFPVT